MDNCKNCGADQQNRAMCFRGERWCSDQCRKAILKKDKENTSIDN